MNMAPVSVISMRVDVSIHLPHVASHIHFHVVCVRLNSYIAILVILIDHKCSESKSIIKFISKIKDNGIWVTIQSHGI